MQNFLLRLLLATLKRFVSKTPWFIKVIQVISVITALITGLPALFEHMGLNIPEAWSGLYNETVSWAAAVAAFIAQFTDTTETNKNTVIKD